jgi:hypothetical protein
MQIKGKTGSFLALMVASIFFCQSCATTTKGTFQEKPVTSNLARAKVKKKGAFLEIQKINGEQISGELIAVKRNSLLLNISGMDRELEIKDFAQIKAGKKSKAGLGATFGCIFGAGGGFALCVSCCDFRDGLNCGAAFAFPGILLGTVIGALVRVDDVFKIEGSSPKKMATMLEKLREKARFPDYQ